MKRLQLLFLTLFMCSCMASNTYEMLSPNKDLSMSLSQDVKGNWVYTLANKKTVVIDTSSLGYQLKSGEKIPSKGWSVSNVNNVSVEKEWAPVWGKRSVVADVYNELEVEFSNDSIGCAIPSVSIRFRLYDDGLAYQYVINDGIRSEASRELTEFRFNVDPVCWFYNWENANYGPIKLSEVEGERVSNVTMKLSDDLFVNIHEAALLSGDPLRFNSEKGSAALGVSSSAGVFGCLESGYTSAWRVVMVGKTAGALTDSHMIELLNPEPDLSIDFSWVQPSVAVWDWRIDGAEWDGFTYGMDYPSWVKMVDFACAQGFKYLVLDANWYGPEFEHDSDPVKGDKAQDVQQLLAYAKGKGVGVWLYLNDVGGRKYPIEETLNQYGEWGAAGVKYGFMRGSAEEKNLWTQKITRLCAENRLLVDFHDAPVHPYGQMRTWPNAVTREFCHAQLDAHRVFVPSTFCTSVFVNMVAGPIDMNNGMFDLRQGNTTRVDESQPVPSTLASEAARTLIVFSGATILPDIPEYYQKYPDLLDFISSQKMPWRESRTLQGEIGEYIVMMRQSDDDAILVGAATNEQARDIELPLSFLGDGSYDVVVMEDGENANYLTNRESIRVSKQRVFCCDKLKLRLAPGGGACLKFTIAQ